MTKGAPKKTSDLIGREQKFGPKDYDRGEPAVSYK